MNATKKFFLVLTVMCGLAGTMASCKDCVDCDCTVSQPGYSSAEFCEDDFNSKSEYEKAVDNAEAAGCDCR